MENYESNYNDYEIDKAKEVDYLNELFGESSVEKESVSLNSLRKLALGALLAVYGSGELKRSRNLNALVWTKTNPNPEKYESASYLIRHDKDIDVWSLKYRQIDSSIIDNETGWASLVSEYKFLWDNDAVLEATSVERFAPSHTLQEVEAVSDIISFNLVDKDSLGEELYDELEASRDVDLVTPYSQGTQISQDEINAIADRIKRLSNTQADKWGDYGQDMPDLFYNRMGKLVDEMIKNRDSQNNNS